MKRILLIGWLVAAGCCWADDAQVAGLWKNTAEGIQQSSVIISQQGASIHVAGYGVWAYGAPGVWHRKGAKPWKALGRTARARGTSEICEG